MTNHLFSQLVTKSTTLIPPPSTSLLNIAFATDKNYAKHIGVALYSVVESNINSHLCFHLFIDDISQEDITKLHQISDEYQHFGIVLHTINDTPLKSLPILDRISIAMYYRFAIASTLYGVADKVLYLDVDVICLGELHTLFALEMHDCIVGAVPDGFTGIVPCRNRLHELGFNSILPYFNSGVLLINTKQWMAHGIDDKIWSLIDKFSKKQVFFHDQDLLNVALQNHVFWLMEYYNWQEWGAYAGSLSCYRNDIRLAHLLGETKPWTYCLDIAHTYDEILQRSPYKDYRYPLPNNPTKNQLRKYGKYLWKCGEKSQAIQIFWRWLWTSRHTPT